MAFIIILILGLVLRLINLNQSLWLDETTQAVTSLGTFRNIFVELQGDFHPPLYHILMWGWAHLFGNGEIVMRIPSVLFGVATIWSVYQIGKLIKPKGSLSFLTALLMAIAPFHVYYSQEVRTYAFTAFITCLSFYYFLRLILNKNPNKLGYILATVLMLYADYYGLFTFFAQIIASLFLLRKKITKIIPSFILICLFFIPCLFLLSVQLKTGSQATFFLPEWGRLVNLSFLKALPLTFIKFSIGRITIFNKNVYALVSGIIFIVYGFLIVKGLVKNKKLSVDKPLAVILFWLAIPIFLAWGISFLIPNYQPFRLLLVLPAFYLLLTYGLSSIKNKITFIIFLAFAIIVSGFSLMTYYTNPYFHREDWRGAFRFIKQKAEEDQIIKNISKNNQDNLDSSNKTLALLPSETTRFPYDYYSQDKKVLFMGVAKGFATVQEENLIELSENITSVCYIYYLADLFDPQGLIPNWLESQKFVKIGEVSFNQIRIQKWQSK